MDDVSPSDDRLQAEVQQLRAENERLRGELKAALTRIEELERAAARQAAPFRRRDAQKVAPEERKRPGRKPGHPGSYRLPPQRVDREIEVPMPCCPKCGGQVSDRSPLIQTIEEIPPLRPLVVRLITWSAGCPCCGRVETTHPLQTSRAQGAAATQLGPRALALAALLNKQLGNTMRGTCRILKKVCGLSVTPGGLAQALARIADKLEIEYEALVRQLRASPAVFADETSWWVGGPGWWLWGFTTPETTVYRVDESRGSQVVREVLGDEFAGMLVSDCLSSYDPVPYRKHKCITHHLKAIKEAGEQPGASRSSYLAEWRLFFVTVLVITHVRSRLPPEEFVERRAALEAWCDRLLGQACEQPGEVAVRNRLKKQRLHLLGCLYEPAAEATNNRAERALRPAVIARKLSCGNKTRRGRSTWQVLASLAQSCAQRGQDFTEFVAPRLALKPS
jgi:hypothetical protein